MKKITLFMVLILSLLSTRGFSQQNMESENKKIIANYFKDGFVETYLEPMKAAYSHYKKTGEIYLAQDLMDEAFQYYPDKEVFVKYPFISFENFLEFVSELAYKEDKLEFYKFEGKKYDDKQMQLLKKYNIVCDHCESLKDQHDFADKFWDKARDEVTSTSSKYYNYLVDHYRLEKEMENWDRQAAVNWFKKNRKRFIYNIKADDGSIIRKGNINDYMWKLCDSNSDPGFIVDYFEEFVKGDPVMEKEFFNTKIRLNDKDRSIAEYLGILMGQSKIPQLGRIFIFNLFYPYLSKEPGFKESFTNALQEGINNRKDYFYVNDPDYTKGKPYYSLNYSCCVPMVGRVLEIVKSNKYGQITFDGTLMIDGRNIDFYVYKYDNHYNPVSITHYQGDYYKEDHEMNRIADEYLSKMKSEFGFDNGITKKTDKDIFDVSTFYTLYNKNPDRDKWDYRQDHYAKDYCRIGYNLLNPTHSYDESLEDGIRLFTRYWKLPKKMKVYDLKLYEKHASISGPCWAFIKDTKTGKKYKYAFEAKNGLYNIYLNVVKDKLISIN